MEIPKTKILIYLLTFAGYAWSGYGSNILANLKDAVLAAENVFGDILVKAIDIVHGLKTVHDTFNDSINEDCIFSCPGGVKPVKNKYSKPVSNGCGPMNIDSRETINGPALGDGALLAIRNDLNSCEIFNIEVSEFEAISLVDQHLPFPEMSKCCNEHDICYGICNNNKDKCDLEFKRCLYRNCDGIESDLAITGCKTSAKVLYTATTALGCKFYQDAQRSACYCAPPKHKKYASNEL